MRILHISDQAGVSFVLAKYQTLHGQDSKTNMNTGPPDFDNFSH